MIIEDMPLYVSQFNLHDDIMGMQKLPAILKFYDTTLRDGEQTIGLALSKENKLRIAKALDVLGVDRIEAGMPIVSKEDKAAIEMIMAEGLKAEIWGFCRSVQADIDACLDVDLRNIICESPVSGYKMEAYKFTPASVLERIKKNILYAKEKGLYVAFFAVDATRAHIDFLEKAYRVAVNECGADEVVIVDTLGVATPETMYYLTKKLSEWVNVPISTHCHNDFGMAAACTMASVKAGAQYAQVTINGLGEKCGNADIAEVALAALLYGIKAVVNFEKIYETAKLVEEISGIKISPLKPCVGENVFKRESGVAVAQMISYPPAVEGYPPELLGRERQVLLSKKSGRSSIKYMLEKYKMKANPAQIDEILSQVKALGIRKNGIVEESEFVDIAEGILVE